MLFLKSVIKEELLVSLWRRHTSYLFYWFSRSAWSLVVIVRWYQLASGLDKPTIWVPDYFCNQSLDGIRKCGVDLVFYPITAHMTPAWEECHVLAKKKAPHLFLLTHYFGQMNEITETKAFCRQYKALLIEDCAHVFLPNGGIGVTGDFILYSPHKTLGLSDGALLLINPSVMCVLNKKPEGFSEIFKKVLEELPEAVFPVKKWLLKKAFSTLCPHFLMQRIKLFRCKIATNKSLGLAFPAKQSWLSRHWICLNFERFEAYGWQRYYHAVIIYQFFLKQGQTERLTQVRNTKFPYMIGIDTDKVQMVSQLGKYFFGLKWPDLAPEVLSEPAKHRVAIELEKQLRFFPVHHKLNMRRILASVSKELRDGLETKKMKQFDIIWDIGIEEWEKLFSQAYQTHLQQSRAYVEAFQKNKGWVPRFCVIQFEGINVAVFVVLEKQGPLGFVLARLNRGPIWLDHMLDETSKIAALRNIARYYGLKKRKCLFLAPNLLMQPNNLYDMHINRFSRRLVRPSASIWVDLSKDTEALRISLDGKWRNQLSFAERKGIYLDRSSDKSVFDWLVKHHEEDMKQRGYLGPSANFLNYLWSSAKHANQELFILRAFYAEQCIAGIALLGHGTSATYLLGYNSNKGRQLNANNFLLWNAILSLKSAGYKWFDLGGVNEYAASGIAFFKRGIRGEEYCLIGEYSYYSL